MDLWLQDEVVILSQTSPHPYSVLQIKLEIIAFNLCTRLQFCMHPWASNYG